MSLKKQKIIKTVVIGFVAILVAIVFPPARLFFLLWFAFLQAQELWKMALINPKDIKDYKRKTDKELYIFVVKSCITAFFFALISFQIFIYIALLYWFYFIFFMLMFSKVWKFHGKKNSHLFLTLTTTTIVSFIAAPFIRAVIPDSFIYFLLL